MNNKEIKRQLRTCFTSDCFGQDKNCEYYAEGDNGKCGWYNSLNADLKKIQEDETEYLTFPQLKDLFAKKK